MNDTARALIDAALELFAEKGYDGASVRAITTRAGANLGAITYHFGSKDLLYEAAFVSVAQPFREHLKSAVSTDAAPLDRIESLVRAWYHYLAEHRSFSPVLLQHLASARPMPEAGRRVMRANLELIASVIAAGQRDGSIRQGDARLMALSIGSQPMFLSLVRHALRDGAEIDQDDPATGRELVESVVRFVRAGLAAKPTDT